MTSEILNEQQIALLGFIRQGIHPQKAIRMAGMEFEEGRNFLEKDTRGVAAIDFNRELHKSAPIITRDLLTSQLYEERARSTNSMEGVACLREIGKINGLYETTVILKDTDNDAKEQAARSLNSIQKSSDETILQELQGLGLTIDLEPEEINRD